MGGVERAGDGCGGGEGVGGVFEGEGLYDWGGKWGVCADGGVVGGEVGVGFCGGESCMCGPLFWC